MFRFIYGYYFREATHQFCFFIAHNAEKQLSSYTKRLSKDAKRPSLNEKRREKSQQGWGATREDYTDWVCIRKTQNTENFFSSIIILFYTMFSILDILTKVIIKSVNFSYHELIIPFLPIKMLFERFYNDYIVLYFDFL